MNNVLEPKKVIFIAPIPFFFERGACLKVRDIMFFFVENGFKVDILTYPNGRDLDIPGVNIIRVKKFFSEPPLVAKMSVIRLITDFKLLLMARSFAKSHRNEYSLILTKTPIGGLIGAVVKKILKNPLLADINEPLNLLVKKYTEHHLITGKCAGLLKFFLNFKLVRLIIQKLEKFFYRNANVIFANWELSAESIRKQMISKQDKVVVLHSAILYNPKYDNNKKTINENPVLKARLGELKGKKVIGYAGGFERYQGVDICLKAFAFAKIRDAIFILAGNYNPYDAYYENLVKELKIDDKVVFLGRVRHDELYYVYSYTHLLLTAHDLPGDCGASSKIIEYMFQKKPVIGVDNPQNRQIITNREVFLAKRTPEDFARVIKWVFNNYPKAVKQAQVAFKYSQKKFGKEEFSKKIRLSLNTLGFKI